MAALRREIAGDAQCRSADHECHRGRSTRRHGHRGRPPWRVRSRSPASPRGARRRWISDFRKRRTLSLWTRRRGHQWHGQIHNWWTNWRCRSRRAQDRCGCLRAACTCRRRRVFRQRSEQSGPQCCLYGEAHRQVRGRWRHWRRQGVHGADCLWNRPNPTGNGNGGDRLRRRRVGQDQGQISGFVSAAHHGLSRIAKSEWLVLPEGCGIRPLRTPRVSLGEKPGRRSERVSGRKRGEPGRGGPQQIRLGPRFEIGGSMILDVAPEMRDIGLSTAVLIARGLDNSKTVPELLAYRKVAGKRLASAWKSRFVSEHPAIQEYHRVHELFGVKDTRPAPEELVQYVRRNRDFTASGAVIDCYNVASARTLLSMGAHDLDRLEFPIAFRRTSQLDAVQPPGP